MKKTTFIKFIAIAAAVSAVSCSRENSIVKPSPEKPETETEIEGGRKVSFSAGIEGIDGNSTGTSSAESKTAIDDKGKVTWNQGDAVRIYWDDASYASASAKEAGSSTSFGEVNVEESDYYYAVYPAEDALVDPSASTVTMSIPQTQSGLFEDVNRMVARTLEGGAEFKFFYISSIVKFNIVRSDVKAVTLRSADGSAIFGSVTTDFSAVTGMDDTPEFTVTPEDGGDEITIAIDGPGTYYAAILPGRDIAGGLLFRCETEDDYLPAATTKVSQASVRGKVKNYVVEGGLDSKIITDFYVTSTGAGKKHGGDISNALDPDGFRSLIADCSQDAEAARSQAFRLYGTKFHCDGVITIASSEKGTPVIAFDRDAYEKNVSLTILGGTLSGSGETNIITISDNAEVTFDGVTFTDGYSEADASGNYGAAIRVVSSTAKVSASNCTFTGNQAVEGGALYMTAGAFEAESCTFSSNSATVAYNRRGGGAVRIAGAAATAGFENCTFSSNTTAGGGGAFCVTAGKAAADKCAFTGNSAGKYGGCFNAEGSDSYIYLNKCKVYGNSASGWGSSVNTGDGSTLAMNACTFTANTNTGSNDASMVLKSKTTMLNCTIVEDVQQTEVISFEGTAASTLSNNIIIAEDATVNAVYMNSSNHQVTSNGGNLIGRLSGSSFSNAQKFSKQLYDVYNYKHSEMTSPSWNESQGAFSWGDSTIDGFIPSKAGVVRTSAGSDFSTWLGNVDTDAFSKDIAGNSRNSDGLRPGAWEGSSISKSANKLSLQHLMAYFQWGESSTGIMVMSHRCHINSKNQTENSVASGKQALSAGADILEIDPRRTSDGEIILMHDKNIENMTTNGTYSVSRIVEESTLSTLQSYYLIKRSGYGEFWSGPYKTSERIPTLGQFLDGVAAAKTYYICLDLSKVLEYSDYMSCIKKIADIVADKGMMDHTLFYVHKANAGEAEDKMTQMRENFATWGYPDASVYCYPYGSNTEGKDPNYKWELAYPQYVYAIQASYNPGKGSSEQHNLKYPVQDGMVATVNLLNELYGDIPEYRIDNTQINSLLAGFPYCHVISTDCPAELISILVQKGLYPVKYEDEFNPGSSFEGYDDNDYNW